MKILWLLPALALCLPMDAAAASGSRSHRSHSSAGSHLHEHGLSHRREQPPPSTGKHDKSSTRCTTCQRDEHGRVKRSEDARRAFMRQTGYPHGRKGYVIDHVPPLACGGSDTPSNMQWQTTGAAKAKDKTERNGCKR